MDAKVQDNYVLKSVVIEKAGQVEQACVALALKKATRAISRRFDDLIQPSGLRWTQASILLELAAYGPFNLKELSARLSADKSTMSRNIKPLEEQGLLTRKIYKGRRKHILLTEKGEKKLEEVFPLWHIAQNEVLNFLKMKKIEDLAGNLCEISKYSDERDL